MSSARARLAPIVFVAVAACGGTAPQQTAAVPAAASASASSPQPSASSSAPMASALPAGLPPLPLVPVPPARPMETVRAVYTFAAEHPEVLSKMPCFCGCEHRGHQGNADCFVSKRDERGRVVQWEPHGIVCEVCLDVAHDAMQGYASGASLKSIRASIEAKYRPYFESMTPTPPITTDDKPGSR